MPIYEYECESCGTHFDKIQSMNDEPVRLCPECSGVVHKVFHPAGIIFKGSGWYITDSRKNTSSTVSGDSKPAEASAKTETKPASAPDAKTEPKVDAKSQAKAETKSETKPTPTTDAK